jgi:hypothetical protein
MASPILTSIEEQLLQDNSIFHTKAAIDAKISDLLGALKREIETSLLSDSLYLPAAVMDTPGRLYRGENLGALPWRALDCPRLFNGRDMFCYRTLLVWGRDFSFHLLLGGQWLTHYTPKLIAAQAALGALGWQMSQQKSPWDWGMSQHEYVSLSSLAPSDFARQLSTQDWLKLSMTLPLQRFTEVPSIGSSHFAALITTLQ